MHGPTPKIIAAVGDRAVLWGTDSGLEINNAGFEHSQPAPGSAKEFFLTFKIVSLECKVQTLEGGRGWGMIFPFQMLLNVLQEVLHRSVFSLVFNFFCCTRRNISGSVAQQNQ